MAGRNQLGSNLRMRIQELIEVAQLSLANLCAIGRQNEQRSCYKQDGEVLKAPKLFHNSLLFFLMYDISFYLIREFHNRVITVRILLCSAS